MKKFLIALLAFSMAVSAFGCRDESKPDPQNPVRITAWTYYNGAQQEAIEALIQQFNSGEGLKQGIVVEHMSQGAINTLSDELLLAAKGGAGAQQLPNLALSYPETAFALDKLDLLVELERYFSKEELAAYIPAFIEEGRLTKDGPVYIMPVAKSTEIFALNKTDWDKFAAETGASVEALSTVEGVAETAEAYYRWTDSLTPAVEGDGKAFFGRDAMDNYMVVGSAQLGKELFPVDGDKEAAVADENTMRTLWDCYYVPFIKGYFASEGKFASDDVKTGKVISYVGSSSSIGFFPSKVTLHDDSTYAIEAMVLPAPVFENAVKKYRVQQGAGFCVLKSTEPQEYACAQFLKWFTAEEQNLAFATDASYLPVTISANEEEKIASVFADAGSLTRMALSTGAELIREGELYISKPFEGMDTARRAMKSSLLDVAKEDRAAVLLAVEQGKDAQEAQAPYLTEARFTEWYQAFSEEFITAIGR